MTLVNLRATAPYGWVTVYLLGDAGPESALELGADRVVLETVVPRTKLNGAGYLQVELTPNADLTPSGTAYRADFQATASRPVTSLVFGGFTGDGPVEATDWVTDPPGALAPPALAVHLADAVDAHDASAVSVVPFGTIEATDVQAALEEVFAEGGGGGGGGDHPDGDHTSFLAKASNLGDLPSPTTARSNLGLGTAATQASSAFDAAGAATAAVAAEVTARNLAITLAIANLLDSAPGVLDTLNELAAALGDDPNFAATITALVATKETPAGAQAKVNAHEADTTAVHGIANTANLLTTASSINALLDVNTAGDPITPLAALVWDGTDWTPSSGAFATGDALMSESWGAILFNDANAATVARTGHLAVAWLRENGSTALPANRVAGRDIVLDMNPVATGSATVTPAAISATVTMAGPTLHTGSVVSPAAIAATVTMAAPIVDTAGGTGATVTPAAISATATVAGPTVSVGSTVAPAAIAAVVTMAAPTVTTPSSALATPSHLLTETSNSDLTVYVTASVTIPSGQVTLLAVMGAGTNHSAPTVTQTGVTWDLVVSVNDGGSNPLHLFRAAPGSPATGTITITYAALRTGCGWSVVTIANSISTSNGAGGLGTAVTTFQGSGATISVTLAALANARSASLGFLRGVNGNVATEGSGFTALSQDSKADSGRIATEWRQNVTTVDWTVAGATRLIGVEVKAI